MNGRNKHLVKLSERNWYRMGTFVSASDDKGNWIYGDGTYCLRFKGKPYIQEGEKKHLNRMVEVLELASAAKWEIVLPSNSYMKKLNAATHKHRVCCKIEGFEIFVDTRLLFEMMKVLHKAKGYAAYLKGYTPSNKEKTVICIYIKGENGDGLLMPLECKNRA